MKKIIFSAMLLITVTATYSQQSNPSPTLTKQDYLQKSKKQKTAAWILLGGGLLSSALGSVRTNPDGIWGGDASNSNQTVFLVTGVIAISASIPLFIASSKNKKKAASLSFKNEPIPRIQRNNLVNRNMTTLTLKISL